MQNKLMIPIYFNHYNALIKNDLLVNSTNTQDNMKM